MKWIYFCCLRWFLSLNRKWFFCNDIAHLINKLDPRQIALCNCSNLLTDERAWCPNVCFGNWWQYLRTNGCFELYLKGYPYAMLEDHMLVSRLKEEDYLLTKVLFKELSKDWSCESWAYWKHVLKKKIIWTLMFTFKTSSMDSEKKRFKVELCKFKRSIMKRSHDWILPSILVIMGKWRYA